MQQLAIRIRRTSVDTNKFIGRRNELSLKYHNMLILLIVHAAL